MRDFLIAAAGGYAGLGAIALSGYLYHLWKVSRGPR